MLLHLSLMTAVVLQKKDGKGHDDLLGLRECTVYDGHDRHGRERLARVQPENYLL